MTKQELYRSKLGTLEGALAKVQSGDCIATGFYGNEPSAFLQRLHTIANRVERVHLWSMLVMERYPVMELLSLKGKIDILTYFYDDNCRNYHGNGRYSYFPMDLHSAGRMTVEASRPNLYVCAVSPMDEQGTFSLSFDLQASLEWIDHADTVIFEVNPLIPRTCGETSIPIERVDYIYEIAPRPLPTGPSSPSTDADKEIAGYVASLICDGDCIQLGIGGIPDKIGMALLHKHDLGIHTEMITSSMGQLIRSGAVTNARKNLNPGKTVGAFAWGDESLYSLMENNPIFELRRSAYVNNPFIIAENENMVSVNTALQIDLTGQVCSESMGSTQFSGTGGAADFAYGAFHAKGGRGIIAFRSTAKDGTVSRIQPQLTPGAVVSISRNWINYVVTEYGIANLKGKSIRQRVDALIAIAHPDFRNELRKEASRLQIW